MRVCKKNHADQKCLYCKNRNHCTGKIERYPIQNGATYCVAFVMDEDEFISYLQRWRHELA